MQQHYRILLVFFIGSYLPLVGSEHRSLVRALMTEGEQTVTELPLELTTKIAGYLARNNTIIPELLKNCRSVGRLIAKGPAYDAPSTGAFDPVSSRIALLKENYTIALYSVEGTCLQTLPHTYYGVTFVRWSEDGKTLLLSNEDGVLRINPDSREKGSLILEMPLCTFFETKGDMIAAVSNEYKVVLTNGAERWTIPKESISLINCMRFSHQGDFLVVGFEHGEAIIWDTTTREEVVRLNGHRGSVRFAAFFPDDTKVLTSGEDNELKIWDSESGECLRSERFHSVIEDILFEPERIVLLTVFYGPMIYELSATGITHLDGTNPQMMSLAQHASFSGKGEYILTQHAGEIYLWQPTFFLHSFLYTSMNLDQGVLFTLLDRLACVRKSCMSHEVLSELPSLRFDFRKFPVMNQAFSDLPLSVKLFILRNTSLTGGWQPPKDDPCASNYLSYITE